MKTLIDIRIFIAFSFLALININTTNAQCNTNIVAARDTIACGENIFLQQVGVGGVSSDDFSGSTLSGLWQSATAGYTIGGPCGTNPNGGVHLWFGNGCAIPRTATTVPVDASCGGNICFDFRQETQGGACDGPDLQNEGVYLQYKVAGGVWTTINYFSPIGFPYTGWQNHCFAIPVPAQTTTTQFRWHQTSASSVNYDFWGIDNVNIATCSGYSSLWSGGGISSGYNLDTITVSPVTNTTYNLMYSNWINDTCTADITIIVDQPSIVSSNISSACAGSDTLDAQATIAANCEYTLELYNYLPGSGATQPGWSAGGSPIQYHNLDIYINGPLYSNYTMTTGGNFTAVSYLIPLTDGDQLDAVFTNMGTAASECMYRIYDSQNNLITQQGFPGSPPGNYSTTASCPATANYNYSWTNLTSGGSIGLNNPNVQNPLATVSVPTQFQVTAYDSLNPQCIAIDTVQVAPSASNISATLIGDTIICLGDPVTLNFPVLVGAPPYDIDMLISNSTGSIPATYQIDQFGLQTSGLGSITFYPTENTTYSIINLSDASGCPASVTNPNLSVVVNTIPNAGTNNSIDFCATEPSDDLSNFLGLADNFGYWTPPGGAPITNGLNLIFDPQNDPAGAYTYTVDNAPCPSNSATILVNLIPAPYAGGSTPINQDYCQNDLTVDISSLLSSPDPNGTWSGAFGSSTSPIGTATFNFNPSNDPSGNYTYTVSDPNGTCPDATAQINININAVPTVAVSSITTNICEGGSTCLDFNLTGSPNFTLDISDGSSITTTIVDANGNDLSGNCYSVSPSTSTTYTITKIEDNNNCIEFSPNTSILINVTTLPNAGVSPPNPLNICSDDITTYPLETQLGGLQDQTGYWSAPNPLPPNFSFVFNPQTMSSGIYTYTVEAAPCPNAVESVIVNLVTAPNSGTPNNQEICINNYNAISPYDLNNLINGADPGGNWCVGAAGGSSLSTSNIDPNSYGIGTHLFTYEVIGTTPCINAATSVTLIINPEPIVGSFTSNVPNIAQGNPVNLSMTMMTGTPPFTINLLDNDLPPNTYSLPITPPNMTGSLSVIPNVVPTTDYSINGVITDAKGCTTNSLLTVPITVDPYPVINPFNTTTDTICYGTIPSINMTVSQGIAPIDIKYQYNGTGPIYTETIGIIGQVGPLPSVNILLDTANLTIGVNTINIVSVTDNNGISSLSSSLPVPVVIVVNPTPIVTFSTTTPEICFEQPAILEFGFLVGTAPFNIEYTINTIPQTPLILSGNGTYIITPNPAVGTNVYNMVQATDRYGCKSNINATTPVNIIVNPNPKVDITVSGKNPICIGENSSLFFPVLSGTPPYNLSYLTDGTLSTINIDASGYVAATGTTQPINPNKTTTYKLVSIIDNKSCSSILNDSTKLIVNELPSVDISGSTEICEQNTTQLYFNHTGNGPWNVYYNVNGLSLSANLSNNYDSITISPTTTTVYTIDSVSDINCTSLITDGATITVNPLPEVNVSKGGSVCDDGSEVEVIITTNGGTPPFNIEYSVGINSRSASNISYQYVINTNEAGIYSVTKATDNKNCEAQVITGSATVNVNPIPEANILAYPLFADIINPEINFIDNSTNHVSGIWDFGDGNIQFSNFNEIKHTFKDTGTYVVTLEVITDSGCVNTAEQIIIIDPSFNIYIPDAFTPNNDLYNDEFLPIVNGIEKYSFSIYDRFGKEIFNTDKTNIPWDGKINNGTKYAPAGNYVYHIIIVDFKGKDRVFQGKVMLIR